jgi:uncharacterized protein
MKNNKFILAGVFFGIVLTKGEAISWYRMQEMFHFQSFHMFGIFMTAIPVGAISVILIKKFNIKTYKGETVTIPDKPFNKGIIFGSLIFGFGWALTGACPGPLYAQLGSGVLVTIVTIAAALFGTWTYALVREKLPH